MSFIKPKLVEEKQREREAKKYPKKQTNKKAYSISDKARKGYLQVTISGEQCPNTV